MPDRTKILLISAALACAAQNGLADPSRVVDTIKVGGPDGWDYATFDPGTHMLYIAHGSAIASVNATSRVVEPHLASAQGAHVALPFAGGTKLLITHGKANHVTLNDASKVPNY